MLSRMQRRIGRLIPMPVKAKIRTLVNHRRSRPIGPEAPSSLQIGTFAGFEVAYRKGTADENVISESFGRDTLFPRVPEYQPDSGHVIIDVGAHIGTFALLAASRIPRGRVYAIEPCHNTYNFLRVNIALNKARNISSHNVALSDQTGQCDLFYSSANWGHSIVKARVADGETVNCYSLADFLSENRIDKCHFIKMNAEGAEFPVVLNTAKTILQSFGVFLVLYHCDLWPNNTESDLLSHFQDCGFSTRVHRHSATRGWIVATNDRWRT